MNNLKVVYQSSEFGEVEVRGKFMCYYEYLFSG